MGESTALRLCGPEIRKPTGMRSGSEERLEAVEPDHQHRSRHGELGDPLCRVASDRARQNQQDDDGCRQRRPRRRHIPSTHLQVVTERDEGAHGGKRKGKQEGIRRETVRSPRVRDDRDAHEEDRYQATSHGPGIRR